MFRKLIVYCLHSDANDSYVSFHLYVSFHRNSVQRISVTGQRSVLVRRVRLLPLQRNASKFLLKGKPCIACTIVVTNQFGIDSSSKRPKISASPTDDIFQYVLIEQFYFSMVLMSTQSSVIHDQEFKIQEVSVYYIQHLILRY
jgi:hypothetical protein